MTVYRRPDPIPLSRTRPAESPGALRTVRAESDDLHHLVAREIFSAILNGHFPEGSILPNENRLGEDLGVSRTALREAVKGLASKGIIETRRRRGTMVQERIHWNMLDRDVMSWLRKTGRSDLISQSIWQAILFVMPDLAGVAAAKKNGSRVRRAAVGLQEMELGGTEQSSDIVTIYIEIAKAAGNPFMTSLVSACFQNLLDEDRQFLEILAKNANGTDYLRLAEAIASGHKTEAEQLARQLLTLSKTKVEQTT